MTAEQEAIERLRADVEMWPPWGEEGLVSIADLRALLASHERMGLALEQLQRAVQRVCEQGLVEEAGLWLLDLAAKAIGEQG